MHLRDASPARARPLNWRERRSDLLQWPVIGPFLRWRHARTSLQLVMLLAAAIVVAHGLFGPQIAPANLSTVLTWVHYRGLLVVALLAAGNLFCTGCPMVLTRDAGRRLRMPSLHFPKWLRTKWVGVGLFVMVLFAYELFDLWALPRATAYLVLSYFAAALVIDLLFAGASFCKYLCPIGQFSFVASTVSPLEVRIKDAGVCATCATVDCIKGNPVQRGCELRLFLPMKVGNMDCTLCLDCVHACPRDNVAIAARVPAAELVETRRRSGIGRLTQRGDIAALAMVFVFGGLLNALGMVTPAAAAQRWLSRLTGTSSESLVLVILFAFALVLAPAAIIGAAALSTQLLTRGDVSLRGAAQRYVYAFIPFGFAFWLAHYGFHLLTGALTVVPVTQAAATSLFGSPVLGAAHWHWMGMRGGNVFPLQLGAILLGTLGSLAVAHAISKADHPTRARAVTTPWAAAIVVVAAIAVWIISQPMEMRGMVMPG